jgi:signal peptidase II
MLALILTLAIAGLDQVTKYWILQHFYPGESRPVIAGCFNLVLVRNTGAAWGMFGGFNMWLAALSVAMFVLIVMFRRQLLGDSLVHRVALGFMLGGIVGNLFDRMKLQFVVDFLDFHWGVHHFPSFNVADSAICIGVGLYIVSSFCSPSHPLRPALDGEGPGAQVTPRPGASV